jgi:hypothetical protein
LLNSGYGRGFLPCGLARVNGIDRARPILPELQTAVRSWQTGTALAGRRAQDWQTHH